MAIYKQIDEKEREEIYKLRKQGTSISEIARKIGRHKSSISREIKRNIDESLGEYHYYYANSRAESRRSYKRQKWWQKEKNAWILKLIENKMRIELRSPSIISGELRIKQERSIISHESIYQYIYSNQGLKLGLHKYLYSKRNRRFKRVEARPRNMREPSFGKPLSARPEIADTKLEAGHFELDLLMTGATRSDNLVVLIDKKTRYALIGHNLKRDGIFYKAGY
jgi:transposase, IS30 family